MEFQDSVTCRPCHAPGPFYTDILKGKVEQRVVKKYAVWEDEFNATDKVSTDTLLK